MYAEYSRDQFFAFSYHGRTKRRPLHSSLVAVFPRHVLHIPKSKWRRWNQCARVDAAPSLAYGIWIKSKIYRLFCIWTVVCTNIQMSTPCRAHQGCLRPRTPFLGSGSRHSFFVTVFYCAEKELFPCPDSAADKIWNSNSRSFWFYYERISKSV